MSTPWALPPLPAKLSLTPLLLGLYLVKWGQNFCLAGTLWGRDTDIRLPLSEGSTTCSGKMPQGWADGSLLLQDLGGN